MLWRKSRKRRSTSAELQNDASNITACDPSPEAAWRVENIMNDGPPSESEWWLAKNSASARSSDTTLDSSTATVEDSNNVLMVSRNNQQQQQYEFHNCGFKVWEEGRQKWRRKTNFNHTSPPPVHREDVIQGLSKGTRTFELPGRVSLSDMIDVCVVVWGCEND